MRCPGIHCDGCGGGGAPVGLIALAVAAGVAYALLRAIWHTLVTVAEIVVIVLGASLGAAVLAGLGYAAVRVRRYVLDGREARPVIRIAPSAITEIPTVPRPAIHGKQAGNFPPGDELAARRERAPWRR